MERHGASVRLIDMRRLGQFVTVLASATVLAACGNGGDDTTVVPDDADPGSQTEDTPLAGTYWELDELAAGDSTTEIPGDVGAYLQIEDGAVGGNTGCNTFGGNAEVDDEGGTVEFSEVFSTMRACSGPAGESDSTMMAVLQGTVTVEINGDALTLTNADGDSLRLSAAEEPPTEEPAEDTQDDESEDE